MNLKNTRRNLLVLSNTFKKLKSMDDLLHANTSLIKASMWCRKTMEAIGSENPYAKFDGKRIEAADIAPTFDPTEEVLSQDILDKGLIYTIDQMREFLTSSVKEAFDFYKEEDDITIRLALQAVTQYMIEARMYLGRALGKIRDEGENAPEVTL